MQRHFFTALVATAVVLSSPAQAQTYPSRGRSSWWCRTRRAARSTLSVASRRADGRAPRPAGGRGEHHGRRRHHRGDPRHQRQARWLYDSCSARSARTPTTRRSTRSAAMTRSATSRRSRCSPSSRWCWRCARTCRPTPFAEFAALLKTDGAKMQYGSAGAGSTTHLACSLLNARVGVNVTHVPYRGSAPAMNDLIGGQIDYLCGNLGAVAPLIANKQVKALALLSKERSPLMPDLPTAHEQGLDRLRRDHLGGDLLAEGRAEGGRRQVERGHPCHDGDACHQGADARDRRDRRRAGAQNAGISRKVCCRRNRPLGRPDQVGRASGGLMRIWLRSNRRCPASAVFRF